jgi:hypothetical protein
MLARVLFRALTVALAFGLTLISFNASAQSSWSLTNLSNQRLEFETFDPARGSWTKQAIYPNQRTSYTLDLYLP